MPGPTLPKVLTAMLAAAMLLPLLPGALALGVGETPRVGLAADARADASEVGNWRPVFDGQVPAVNMVLMPNGNVLYWSGVDGHDGDTIPFLLYAMEHAEARVLDLSGPEPVVRTPTPADGGSSDLFCSDQTVLPDGTVLVVGGSQWTTALAPVDNEVLVLGTEHARLFDPVTETFRNASDMHAGRWYPSTLTLQDGTALVSSGITRLSQPDSHVETLERYHPHTDAWEVLPGSTANNLPLYPRLHVVPSGPLKGDLLYQPVGCLWCPFGEHPKEALWNFAQSLDLDSAAWTMHDAALFGMRQHATVVPLMLRPPEHRAEYVTIGGTLHRSTVASNLVEYADYTALPPAREAGTPMAEGRWHLNSVLLPTGEIVSMGGGRYDNVVVHGNPNLPVLAAEVLDPDAVDPVSGLRGRWTTMAEMEVPRMYHSTALLLPDGRVMMGGHVPLPHIQAVVPQILETRLEIFEPPYLFRGARPVIAEAPASVQHGQAFPITTPDADKVTRAVLMAPGSVTHAWDSDQRAIELEVTGRGDGTLQVVAPPDADVARPGHYMLFLLADNGQGETPSVAHWLALGAAPFGQAAGGGATAQGFGPTAGDGADRTVPGVGAGAGVAVAVAVAVAVGMARRRR